MTFFRENNKKGQLAPFMIAVIVILLMAIMVTVNLGKISLTRTATSNAADAGALAGGSTMANGLNAIRDISDTMMADYITTQLILLAMTCWGSCRAAVVITLAHKVSQIALYLYARKIAKDTLKEAKNASLQLAFSNAGIDEAKPRGCKRKGSDGECEEWETWEEWTGRQSGFEQWMAADGYLSGVYSWQDIQKYGQMQSAGTNSVTVSSNPPKWSVIPLPGVIVFVVERLCTCPGGSPTLMGIASVSGDTDPISISVTRVEPDINIGLWQMRYRREGESGITNSSQGHAEGGSVMPFGSDYDSELTGAQ